MKSQKQNLLKEIYKPIYCDNSNYDSRLDAQKERLRRKIIKKKLDYETATQLGGELDDAQYVDPWNIPTRESDTDVVNRLLNRIENPYSMPEVNTDNSWWSFHNVDEK